MSIDITRDVTDVDRYDVFKANLKKMEGHNWSGAKWTMGVNQFSDMTEAEFQAQV